MCCINIDSPGGRVTPFLFLIQPSDFMHESLGLGLG